MDRHPPKSGAPRRPRQAKSAFSADRTAPDKAYSPLAASDEAASDVEGARRPAKRRPPVEKSAVRQERVAKVLARAGVASRREIERLIGLGKVSVNGRILDGPAVLVGPDDVVAVDGRTVGAPEPTRVWRYHKPVGLVTTHSDPRDRPTVFSALPDHLPRVISVGRLDLNSEGLLLLTNDGELARALELPASGWIRTYRARALGRITQEALDRLKSGVVIEGLAYGPIDAKLDKALDKPDGRANVWITVSISEGKNREVRKVLEHLGLRVNRLIRLAYGPFQLGALEIGQAEEVGPRVLKEMLPDLPQIQNLSLAESTQTRPDGPRGARTGQGVRREGTDRFARPKRDDDGPKRAYAPRPPRDGARDDRPARSFDDRKPRDDRSGGGGDDRPKRAYAPRPPREGARDDRPARSFDDRKPRDDRSSGDDRPKRAYAPRPPRDGARDDRPARSFDDRKPRDDRGGGDDRPKRAYGPRPPRDGDGERPRGPRPSGGFARPGSSAKPPRGPRRDK